MTDPALSLKPGPTESEEPTDPKSIMYRAFASNPWIVGLTVVSVAATGAALWLVVRQWPAATGEKPGEAEVLLMIILMGALGGLVHLTSSFAKFVGNRQLLRSWLIYYLLMPIEGAALAPMIYLLLRAGVIAPNASSQNGATANLNVVVLYGFAGLTGLFSKQAIEMLADVFATIFKRVKAKDGLTDKEQGTP